MAGPQHSPKLPKIGLLLQCMETVWKMHLGVCAKHWLIFAKLQKKPLLVMYFRSLNLKSIVRTLSGWLKFKIFRSNAGEDSSKTKTAIQIEQQDFDQISVFALTRVSSQLFLEIYSVQLLRHLLPIISATILLQVLLCPFQYSSHEHWWKLFCNT